MPKKPLRQESSKKEKVSSDNSIASNVVSSRPKLSLSKMSDELALKTLSMFPFEVQMATATFHKYWMNRWKSFIKSNDSTNLFTTTVSQTRAFRITIEVKVLYKKNKEFLNRTS